MTRFRRPGRQPGSFTAGREGRVLLVLVAGIGLAFLRSYLSLSLLEATERVAEEQRSLDSVRQELDWQRVEVQRLASPSRIEPAASREGFVQPDHRAVILLTTRESAPPLPLRPGARPLRALGAGVLVHWFERAAKAATISAAAAAGHSDPGMGAGGRGSADALEGKAAKGQCDAGEHGERVARCEFCRALAAGRARGH